jgi:hypothetical protein
VVACKLWALHDNENKSCCEWVREKHFWIFDYIFALYSCGSVSKWCDKQKMCFVHNIFNLHSRSWRNATINFSKWDQFYDKRQKPSKSFSLSYFFSFGNVMESSDYFKWQKAHERERESLSQHLDVCEKSTKRKFDMNWIFSHDLKFMMQFAEGGNDGGI